MGMLLAAILFCLAVQPASTGAWLTAIATDYVWIVWLTVLIALYDSVVDDSPRWKRDRR